MVLAARHCFVVISLVVAASLFASGEEAKPTPAPDKQKNPCAVITTCCKCVSTKIDEANNGTCIWEEKKTGLICTDSHRPSDKTISIVFTKDGCNKSGEATTPGPRSDTNSTQLPEPGNVTATAAVAPNTTATPSPTVAASPTQQLLQPNAAETPAPNSTATPPTSTPPATPKV